jgi:hypothetical protein
MPNVAIDIRMKDYVTDQGIIVRSHRAFVTVQIGSVWPLCFVDTGAPFNIVSSSLAGQIPWAHRGTALLSQGKPISLDWQRIPCELGDTDVVLVDNSTGVRTGPCRLNGKFALGVHPSLEKCLILGMNILVDNNADLVLRINQGTLTGHLAVP